MVNPVGVVMTWGVLSHNQFIVIFLVIGSAIKLKSEGGLRCFSEDDGEDSEDRDDDEDDNDDRDDEDSED